MYTNCNNISNKLNEIRYNSVDSDLDVVCLTETFLSKDICDAEIGIKGFKVFRGDRFSGGGGGSCIYVKNHIKAFQDVNFNYSDCVAIKLCIDSADLILICMYHSTSLTYNESCDLLDYLNKYLEAIPVSHDIIMLGDFNLPNVSWNTGAVACQSDTANKKFIIQRMFLDLFNSHDLTWLLNDNQITRRRVVSEILQESVLDQILLQDSNMLKKLSILPPLGHSDHMTIELEICLKSDSRFLTAEKLNWFKFSEDDFSDCNSNIDWIFAETSRQTSVDDIWSQLYSKLQLIASHVPKRKIVLDSNSQKYPEYVKKAKKVATTAWNHYMKYPSAKNLRRVRLKQDELNVKLYKSQVSYERNITKDLKGNPKRFYAYLNSKRKVRNVLSGLKDKSGNFLTEPTDVANELGEFFTSTYTKEPALSAEHKQQLLDELSIGADSAKNTDLGELVISKEEVKKLLTNLNIGKSMGPDEVHPKLLKLLSRDDDFVSELTTLFQSCYDQGKIPDIWKVAAITAIHKKDDKTLSKNYRPISLTCIVAKLYEKIVRNHILEHFVKYVSPKQHGFLPKKSCLSNLLECLDVAYDILDKSQPLDLIYLDFQKAFDTVPHERLLIKLRKYGIVGKMLNVVKDFLTGRSFYVKIGDASSRKFLVISGIPQGSVLGPLLFLIYINDLPNGLISYSSLFADDVKLLIEASKHLAAQEDLDKLGKWQKDWLLRFNTSDHKCKVMHVGENNPENDYYLDGNVLPKTPIEKDLGVYVNTNLDWKDHIKQAIGKANSVMGWVVRNVVTREQQVMINIYKSLIRPHLEYCVQIWSPVARHGNWGIIMDIEGVQRRFTRLIDGVGLLPYKERLSKLSITTLLERRMRGDLIEIFKIFKGLVSYGRDALKLSRSGYNILKSGKTNARLDFFTNRAANYWNKLPVAVKDSESVDSFKARLEKYKKSSISSLGNYWELSDEIFVRINDTNRADYTDFLIDNPDVAKRRNVNIH